MQLLLQRLGWTALGAGIVCFIGALFTAFCGCTPAERAQAANDVTYALTAEQAACLVAEHYGPPKDEAAIETTCEVTQAVGNVALAALRAADVRDAGPADAGPQ